MLFKYIVCHCRHRLFEWVMTVAMLGLAIETFFWPETIGASAFRYMLRVIQPGSLGIFFMIAGLFRIAALFANGSWPIVGPRIRAFAAGAAALVWGQMLISLIVLAPHTGIPSPGIPVYLALTLGEIVSAYRAATDGGRTR
jgi:hypothetical protein